ncbi:fibrobacter succinogenes major paralogous domain [Candidatus Ornithobacterium hominis]|uniref:FISUMP domain-containing protein n=1 Tax=Candidatus Ornithobacterium hominis TaxID=2497989 RepID=UPI000E5A5692|nr:FISUMP domain-containing protein [Candidatus Ornithobacterium hominis]SZD72735.1 fibrobacter succinogenes major paralogous domain [Candidatus Ornithobacterium hominis]
MKKLLLSFVVLPGALAMAQVGVNTDQPRSSFDVAYIDPEAPAGAGRVNAKTPQGVNFPNVSTAQRSKFEDMSEGMMIYNTDKQCLEMYLGVRNGAHQWDCIPNVGNESSQRVSVSPASFDGQFIGGVPLSNASVSFTITNNGFSAFNNVDLSDAVTVENEGANITVTGSANNGVSLNGGKSKTLTYTLSGTPRAGQLTARFNKLRLSADQQLTVGKGNANLQNQEHYIVSFAHGSTTIQGNIDNEDNQVRISIPYTGGKGSYDAVSITQDAAPGQGDVTKQITLSIPAGNFSPRGELIATLSVKDGRYPVKQLEPGKDYDIATYNININGSTSKVIIKGIGGIPDRKFKEDSRYKFIYLPVTVEANGYKKTWLNYNLGAEFAKLGANFKPQQKLFGQAAHDEDKTHGSLYQWQSVNNNPCPSGYHVPTIDEWEDFHQAVTGRRDYGDNQMYTQNKLPNLAAAGSPYYDNGSLYSKGSHGDYWSSSVSSGISAYRMYFLSGRSGMSINNRAYGRSVRCIKD